MPQIGADDPLPHRPRRVLVGGTSGAGKTTLARQLSRILGIPYTEIDALHHGPGWTAREAFMADVDVLSNGPAWITEYQYTQARPLLLARCDLVVYLLFSRPVVMRRVVRRTVMRSVRKETLWNGNIEPPLWSIFIDRDHIVRWAWRTHQRGPERVASITERRPDLPVVVLRSPRATSRWLRAIAQQAGGE